MAITDAAVQRIINSNNSQGVESEIRGIQSETKHHTLYKDTTFYEIDHTVASPAGAELSEQDYFDVPFRVKGVLIEDDTNATRTLQYNTKHGSQTFTDIIMLIGTNVVIPISPTRIHLNGSSTDATKIHLIG